MAMSVHMGTSGWTCRRVSILSHRWMADTGATQSPSFRRDVRLRIHPGVALRKPNSSHCSSATTHRADEFAAGDTSVDSVGELLQVPDGSCLGTQRRTLGVRLAD